jgi:hypothetical protein
MIKQHSTLYLFILACVILLVALWGIIFVLPKLQKYFRDHRNNEVVFGVLLNGVSGYYQKHADYPKTLQDVISNDNWEELFRSLHASYTLTNNYMYRVEGSTCALSYISKTRSSTIDEAFIGLHGDFRLRRTIKGHADKGTFKTNIVELF